MFAIRLEKVATLVAVGCRTVSVHDALDSTKMMAIRPSKRVRCDVTVGLNPIYNLGIFTDAILLAGPKLAAHHTVPTLRESLPQKSMRGSHVRVATHPNTPLTWIADIKGITVHGVRLVLAIHQLTLGGPRVNLHFLHPSGFACIFGAHSGNALWRHGSIGVIMHAKNANSGTRAASGNTAKRYTLGWTHA